MESPRVSGASDKARGTFRYVALDLDGTLLNSQHKLSEETIESLRKLDHQGFGILIATGRALNTVYETILTLNLLHPIPVVCSNGARGVLCQPDPSVEPSGVRSTTLFDIPVPEQVARRSITLAKELGFFSQYYVGEDIYADPSTHVDHKNVERYKELTGAKTVCVQDMTAEVLEQNPLPSKQLVLFPEQEQDAAMVQFEMMLNSEEFKDDDGNSGATLVRGNLGWFLEVLHPAVNKGNGLKCICEQHLRVPLDNVVAFGDGDNDIEFLQLAGWGIAMKNAQPAVKQVADQVIEHTNDENGVIRTLEAMLEDGLLILPQSGPDKNYH